MNTESGLFEQRKKDHIRLALDPETQAIGGSGLDSIVLNHEAFPELDFEKVEIGTRVFGVSVRAPLFVSSMTAGHQGSLRLNLAMARVCEKRNWAMGVGSQRRELFDENAGREWQEIRKSCARVKFFGNIGLTQLVRTPTADIQRLVEALGAVAMIVHTNPLQEALQPEGTPQFAGGLEALARLCRELRVPVIVKETGCGFSPTTLERLSGTGVAAVDVSGFGGTHWGRIEGGRSAPGSLQHEAARTFRDWGIGTVDSLLAAVAVGGDYDVWASGGVRTGLDAAKLLAMGAKMVGLAKPLIEAAIEGEEALDRRMEQLEFELKVAMFCTGAANVDEMRRKQAWTKKGHDGRK